jgi:hypothetical protein
LDHFTAELIYEEAHGASGTLSDASATTRKQRYLIEEFCRKAAIESSNTLINIYYAEGIHKVLVATDSEMRRAETNETLTV